jgi:hypothetical protein
MLVNESVAYHDPDKDEASNEALLHEPECLEAPCHVHLLLLKTRCYFVLFLAKFFI